MTVYSFEIHDHKSFREHFVKVAYDEFVADPVNSKKAIVFAMASCHLAEWVIQCDGQNLVAKRFLTSLDATEASVNNAKGVLRKLLGVGYMCDIINGSKHAVLTRPHKVNSSAKVGAFSSAFSRDFDVVRLVFEVDGKQIDFLEYAMQVMKNWDDFFAANIS